MEDVKRYYTKVDVVIVSTIDASLLLSSEVLYLFYMSYFTTLIPNLRM